MDDVCVRFLSWLPNQCPGMTILDENGDYNVYLSDKLTMEEMQRVYDHEMAHVEHGHFYDNRPIAELEKEADMKKEQSVKELLVFEVA